MYIYLLKHPDENDVRACVLNKNQWERADGVLSGRCRGDYFELPEIKVRRLIESAGCPFIPCAVYRFKVCVEDLVSPSQALPWDDIDCGKIDKVSRFGRGPLPW